MSVPELLILGGIATFVYVTIGWVLSLVRRDAGLMDVMWGLGFALLAILYFALTDGYIGRKILVLTLVSAWGIRLTLSTLRRHSNAAEDFRYSEFREKDGGQFWITSYFRPFLLHGSALWGVSVPVLVTMYKGTPDHFTGWDVAGASLWAIGFFFEAVGDLQMDRFRADPANRGRVMRSGLWSISRHPNYFGDALLWWGIFLIAVSTPYGWTTIHAPIILTLILIGVGGGMRQMEPHLRQTKPEFDAYVREVSSFFPLPFRRTKRETVAEVN